MKHIPLRTCVGCGAQRAKRELARLVRLSAASNEAWHVEVDPTGRKAGRGVYLCKQPECWTAALKKKGIERSLEISLSLQDRAQIETIAQQLLQKRALPV